jgi:hypothetical protein
MPDCPLPYSVLQVTIRPSSGLCNTPSQPPSATSPPRGTPTRGKGRAQRAENRVPYYCIPAALFFQSRDTHQAAQPPAMGLPSADRHPMPVSAVADMRLTGGGPVPSHTVMSAPAHSRPQRSIDSTGPCFGNGSLQPRARSQISIRILNGPPVCHWTQP